MKLKKTILSLAAVVLFWGFVPQKSLAQWDIGASYEIRNQEPKNGFGVRIERGILEKLPVLQLGIRGHFSYFNDQNAFNPQSGPSYSREITSYDYGLAAVGGASIGLLTPYVGLGLGSNTTEVNAANVAVSGEGSENYVYWNGFVGAKVSPIPVIKPFVEYRLQSTQEYEDFSNDIDPSDGRLIFGVSLSF